MKYCIYCGEQLLDEAQFCSCCGAATSPADPVPETMQIAVPALADHQKSVRTCVKYLAHTGKATWLVVLMSVSVALNIYFAFFPFSGMEDVEAVFGDFVYWRGFSVAITAGVLLSVVPLILYVLGAWMTIGQARSGNNPKKATGLRVICVVSKIMRVLYPVFIGIVLAAVILLAYMLAKVNIPADEQSLFLGIMIGIFVPIFGGTCVFSIIYYNKLIRTLSSLISAIEEDKSEVYVSRFLIVTCFIGAGSVLSSALGNGWLNFCISASTAVYMLLAGLLLYNLRKSLNRTAYHDRVKQIQAGQGGWVCACGRANVEYIQICNCGRVRPGVRVHDAGGRWACRCCEYVNLPTSRVCARCGEVRVVSDGSGNDPAAWNWRCQCGRINPGFVFSCACGRTRHP